MLQDLQIINLAVVEKAQLNFTDGMTVITGETGAGKSIILDAINLALGARTTSNLVKPGCDKGEICATFDISTLPGAILWLTDLELACSNDTQECIIRRIFYANGRSRAFINGTPATNQQLKILGEFLVQLHGQHQHQLLLNFNEQLRLLDAFGNYENTKTQVQKAYKAWHKLNKEKNILTNNNADNNSKLDLLRYQVDELNQLNLQDNEFEQINQEHSRLAHAVDDYQALNECSNLFTNEDNNISSQLQNCLMQLQKLTLRHPQLQNACGLLTNAQIQIQEAHAEIEQKISQCEINPEKLNAFEEKLQKIHDLARKHRINPENILSHHKLLVKELDCLENAQVRLKQIDEELLEVKNHYLKAAGELTLARKKVTKKLSLEVNSWLKKLGMPKGQFFIELKPQSSDEPTPSGMETAHYMVSTNPGHPLQELTKVASGGELSRISLAIQVIMAQYLNTQTLVFDEVDVGISGKIGAIVGLALQKLGEKAQVICVTHLPQVAACGHKHILVTKHQTKTQTTTSFKALSKNERVEEVARLLGGIDISQPAREQASNLLNENLEQM